MTNSNPADPAKEDAISKKGAKAEPKAQPHPHAKYRYKTSGGLTVTNFVKRK